MRGRRQWTAGSIVHCGQLEGERFLQQLQDEIEEKEMWSESYQEGYVALLHHLTRTVARQLKERAMMLLQMSVDEALDGGQIAR